jgi:hypothetical protein
VKQQGLQVQQRECKPDRDCWVITRIWLLACAWFFVLPSSLRAATDVPAAEEIPPLIPPRAEIPPTVWEQYGQWIVIAGIVALVVVTVLIVVIIRLVTRPKPPVPPATQAREALASLRDQPENGLLLSRVSQVIRHYVIAAFGLPPGELTTAEFSQLVQSHEPLDATLSGALTEFLRRCDEHKFAPSPPSQSVGAVSRALQLVDMAESRRAQLAAEPKTKATPVAAVGSSPGEGERS